VKRLLLLTLAAAVLAVPLTAHAAVPCRDRIYNEWYATGKISTKYPVSCYHDALKNLPIDARVYSNLGSDIKAALRAALSGHGPSAVGHGPGTPAGPYQTKGAATAKTSSEMLAGTVAAPASTGSPLGLPTPILVLGGVALALAAAGVVGSGWRYARRRSR
jgi:opacity protein-like surface antigen